MLVRTSKDKNNPYVMINKTFLEDKNLSLKGKGLLAYCMSKPDGWQFSVLQLAKHLKEGKDSLYHAFEELIELGYCVRDQLRNENGRFGNSDYVLYETSRSTECLMADSPDTDVPDTDVPDAGLSDTAPYILVKNESTNKLKREEGKPPPAHTAQFKKTERAPFIMLTDKEHAELVKKYGETKTADAYLRLSKWKQNTSKSKWKISDFLTIQNWVMDALDEDARKEKKKGIGDKEQETLIDTHREWLKPLLDRTEKPANESFTAHHEGIIFYNTRTNHASEAIEYRDKKFKDLVVHEMRKRKYEWK